MKLDADIRKMGAGIQQKRIAIDDHAMTGVAALVFLVLTFVYYIWNFDQIREGNRPIPSEFNGKSMIPLRYNTDNTFVNFPFITPSETVERERALIMLFRKIDILSSANLFRTEVEKITLEKPAANSKEQQKNEKPFAIRYDVKGDEKGFTDIVFSLQAQSADQVENWRGVVRKMSLYCTDNILVNVNQVGLRIVADLAYTLDDGIGFEDPLQDVQCEVTHLPDRTTTIKLMKNGIEMPYNANSLLFELVNADISRYTPVPNYDISYQQNLVLSDFYNDKQPHPPGDYTKVRSVVCIKENKVRNVLHPLRMLSYLYKMPIRTYEMPDYKFHFNELDCEDIHVWLTLNQSVMPVKKIVFATDQKPQLDVLAPEGTLAGVNIIVNGPNPIPPQGSEKSDAPENVDFELALDDRDFWEFVVGDVRKPLDFNTRLNLCIGPKPVKDDFTPSPTNPRIIPEFNQFGEGERQKFDLSPASLKREMKQRGPSTSVLDIVAPAAEVKKWNVADNREFQILGACMIVLIAIGYYVNLYPYTVRIIPPIGMILALSGMIYGLVEYFRLADVHDKVKVAMKIVYTAFILLAFVLFCLNFSKSRGMPFSVMLNILTFVACFNVLSIVETDQGRNNKLYAYAIFTSAFVCLSLSIAYHNQGIHTKVNGVGINNMLDKNTIIQSLKLLASLGIAGWLLYKYAAPYVYPNNQVSSTETDNTDDGTFTESTKQKIKYASAALFVFVYYIAMPKIYEWRLNITKKQPGFNNRPEMVPDINRLPQPSAKAYKALFFILFYLIYFFVYLFSIELTRIIFHDNGFIQDAKRVRINFEEAPAEADGYFVKERVYEDNLDVYQAPTIALVMVGITYFGLLLVGLHGYVVEKLSYFNLLYSGLFMLFIVFAFVYTKNSDKSQKMIDIGRYCNKEIISLVIHSAFQRKKA